MKLGKQSEVCSKVYGVRALLLAMLLGLVILAEAGISFGTRLPFPENLKLAAVSLAAPVHTHDCQTASGNVSGHCQLPSAATIGEQGGASSPTSALASRRTLLDQLNRTQHRPGGLLRPPNAMSSLV